MSAVLLPREIVTFSAFGAAAIFVWLDLFLVRWILLRVLLGLIAAVGINTVAKFYLYNYQPVEPHADKYVLITGASSGIGNDMAVDFARRGFNVIAVARSKSSLEELAQRVRKECRVKALVIVEDLSTIDGVRRLINEVKEKNLQIQILVNNAGIGSNSPVVETDPVTIEKLPVLNCVAVSTLSRELFPIIEAQGSGRILNVSSIASYGPNPMEAVYGATKAFVSSFSIAMNYEARKSPVRICVLEPTATWTRFGETSGAHIAPAFNVRIPGLDVQMQSADVARMAVYHTLRGEPRIVPGAFANIALYVVGLLPTHLAQPMLKFAWGGGL